MSEKEPNEEKKQRSIGEKIAIAIGVFCLVILVVFPIITVVISLILGDA